MTYLLAWIWKSWYRCMRPIIPYRTGYISFVPDLTGRKKTKRLHCAINCFFPLEKRFRKDLFSGMCLKNLTPLYAANSSLWNALYFFCVWSNWPDPKVALCRQYTNRRTSFQPCVMAKLLRRSTNTFSGQKIKCFLCNRQAVFSRLGMAKAVICIRECDRLSVNTAIDSNKLSASSPIDEIDVSGSRGHLSFKSTKNPDLGRKFAPDLSVH